MAKPVYSPIFNCHSPTAEITLLTLIRSCIPPEDILYQYYSTIGACWLPSHRQDLFLAFGRPCTLLYMFYPQCDSMTRHYTCTYLFRQTKKVACMKGFPVGLFCCQYQLFWQVFVGLNLFPFLLTFFFFFFDFIGRSITQVFERTFSSCCLARPDK